MFIMNLKKKLKKISFNDYFNAILHYFHIYSLSRLTADRYTHSLVFFLFGAARFLVVVLATVEFRW